ncbi:hypothetical protein P280DRAFT_472445 [Massarina eburnea CBS 473.64]|uniref:Phospholipase A2 n=1 Tax=Massarina eburnea CBS 473.64 TaxID=1395130 RepID=A0A6A6RQD8_9PLEO|nr:hypothetical protein P280DRAFT_472445 [Massarina eburnea CBS 473.64]
MRSGIISIIGLVSIALATPANLVSRETASEATDRLLFSSTMSQFRSARAAKNPNTLDWASDGCTSSPENPLGFDFHNSCERHDFGYRNYKAQSRFDEANKQKIDLNFKADMYTQCRSEWWKGLCEDFADVYYAVVHTIGSKRSVEVGEMEERYKREVERLKARGVDVRARNLDGGEE